MGDLIRDFDCNDYVVLLAGVNDATVQQRDIRRVIRACFHTNLLFCTVPGFGSQAFLKSNENIIHSCRRYRKYTNNLNYLELNDHLVETDRSLGTHGLTFSGVGRLARSIAGKLKNFHQPSDSNLVFLRTSGGVPVGDSVLTVCDELHTGVKLGTRDVVVNNDPVNETDVSGASFLCTPPSQIQTL